MSNTACPQCADTGAQKRQARQSMSLISLFCPRFMEASSFRVGLTTAGHPRTCLLHLKSQRELRHTGHPTWKDATTTLCL